jgi:hypothetical protein
MLTSLTKTRPIIRSPSSPESFNEARSWLSTCLESHDHIQSYTSDSMPARLVKVHSEADGQVHASIVLSSESGSVPYFTLSYCWGGDQEFKTTKSSLLASKGVVDVSVLPQTIKDAITVTINMGYNFIWIDSICIVQDDEQDRTKEIARMPEIYSNAICSIAASFPTNAQQGFLQDRVSYTNRIMMFQARATKLQSDEITRLPAGDPQMVYAYPIENNDALVVEPLAERGWCLQERLLSTRVLEYRRNQVRFLCPFTGDHDDSKTDGWTNDWPTNIGDIVFPKGTNGFVPATLLGWNLENIEDFRKLWYSIIEAYTERTLTYPADRTLAISGIAQRLAKMYKGEELKQYTAGHWLSEFPQDLLWYWRCPNWSRNQRETRRCPSWAWTSMDTEVEWPQLFHSYDQNTVEFVNLAVKLKDDDAPFGDVEQATLTIRGRISTGAVCRVTEVDRFPRELRLHDKSTGEELCEPYLDAMTGPRKEEYTDDVILLLIGTYESSEGFKRDVDIAGLILFEEANTNGRRTFSRIGSWSETEFLREEGEQSKMLRLFEGSELETFDLV